MHLLSLHRVGAIVLASPFMGQLQSFLRRSLSTRNYVLLFGVGVVAVGLAILIAFVRIRERRAARFGLLLSRWCSAVAYMWDRDAVARGERRRARALRRIRIDRVPVLPRVWRPAPAKASIIVLPCSASFMVGTLDEWLQWFIPLRVGEAHDVFLNLASIGCGLMFALALQPPPSFSLRTGAAGGAPASALAAAAAWSSRVRQPGASRPRDRRARHRPVPLALHRCGIGCACSPIEPRDGRRDPPLRLRRLSQEDQYLDEGVWHVRGGKSCDAEPRRRGART